MTEAEFHALITSLSGRKRRVYDELLDRGPRDALAFACVRDAGPELSKLAQDGLARRTGHKIDRRMVWEAVTDPAEAEAAAKHGQARGKRWRPSSDPSQPLGLRLAELEKLSGQVDVQRALADPDMLTRRRRTRLRKTQRQVEQLRRARAREFHEAQENAEAQLEFIRIRNGLLDGIDRCRSVAALLEDELEQIVETGKPSLPLTLLAQLVDPLTDGIAKYEKAYALVARLTGASPLPPRDAVLDGELIEDAEFILEISEVSEASAGSAS
jgi:hypothetical protein